VLLTSGVSKGGLNKRNKSKTEKKKKSKNFWGEGILSCSTDSIRGE